MKKVLERNGVRIETDTGFSKIAWILIAICLLLSVVNSIVIDRHGERLKEVEELGWNLRDEIAQFKDGVKATVHTEWLFVDSLDKRQKALDASLVTLRKEIKDLSDKAWLTEGQKHHHKKVNCMDSQQRKTYLTPAIYWLRQAQEEFRKGNPNEAMADIEACQRDLEKFSIPICEDPNEFRH